MNITKKLIATAFAILPQLASAGDTCMAVKVYATSYVSSQNYKVLCGDATLETNRTFTMILLPIPYNWYKHSRSKLDKMMSEKEYKEVAVIREKRGSFLDNDNDYPIFEKTPMNASYCVAYGYGHKVSGIEKKETRFDAEVRCDGTTEKTKYEGVTMSELEAEMTKNGEFRRLFTQKKPIALGESAGSEEFTLFRNR